MTELPILHRRSTSTNRHSHPEVVAEPPNVVFAFSIAIKTVSAFVTALTFHSSTVLRNAWVRGIIKTKIWRDRFTASFKRHRLSEYNTVRRKQRCRCSQTDSHVECAATTFDCGTDELIYRWRGSHYLCCIARLRSRR